MQVIQIEGAKKPLFSWCPDLEPQAMKQMETVAKLPFVEHTAIMPDGHLGENVCIGGVIACKDVIIPSAVGVDISCGMGSIKTNLNVNDFTEEKKKTLHHAVERSIPTGFSHNGDKRQKEIETRFGQKIDFIAVKYETGTKIIDRKEISSQLGTLGGGNHFIELQYDESNNIWLTVHSGSRNIGLRVCNHFNEIAEKLNQQWYSNSPIPFLPSNSAEGKDYISWMNFCIRFSFLNRQAMIEDVFTNIKHYFPNAEIITKTVEGVTDDIINISHNYASQENFGKNNWWVHRKGAVLARKGTIGIIPGSQSTNTFITVGLGNENSLESCSHGSGRKMGRKDFNVKNQHRLHEIEEDMNKKGIVFSTFKKSERGRDEGMYDLSECSDAYKDVVSVMEHQKDLVKPLVKLTPIISWKG